MATLIVLTMWALYNCVAPGRDRDGGDVGHLDWLSPDGPHGEELACLVLLIADDQRGAFAHEVVFPWKGFFSQIHVLAALFVFSVLALYVVVAKELLLQADILTSPLPVSCSTHQVVLILTVATRRTLEGLVTFLMPTLFCGCKVAIGFIFFFFTMNNSIALVLVLDAHRQVLPLPAPCCAHQVAPTISIFSRLNIAATVLARFGIHTISTLARCATCASVASIPVACLLIPERLVGAKLRIDRLPSGSCSFELVAGVGRIRTAPVIHPEAVFLHFGFRAFKTLDSI